MKMRVLAYTIEGAWLDMWTRAGVLVQRAPRLALRFDTPTFDSRYGKYSNIAVTQNEVTGKLLFLYAPAAYFL